MIFRTRSMKAFTACLLTIICVTFARADGDVPQQNAELTRLRGDLLDAVAATPPIAGEDDFPPRSPQVIDKAKMLLARGSPIDQALAKVALKQSSEAFSLIRELQSRPGNSPDDTFALLTIEGDNWYQIFQIDKAVEPYEKALALRPNDFKAGRNVALAQIGSGSGDMAAHRKRAIEVSMETLKLVPSQSPEWADMQNRLGGARMVAPVWWISENLRPAMTSYEAALTVYTKKSDPIIWAGIQKNLGMAYLSLSWEHQADRISNLNNSISAFEAYLASGSKATDPSSWGSTQIYVGMAWFAMPSPDRAEVLRNAISAYDAALTVYTKASNPRMWSSTQWHLGEVWSAMPSGDRSENLHRAISFYEAATDVDVPGRGVVEEALSVAWEAMPTGDRADNLRQAISAGKLALSNYKLDGFITRDVQTHLERLANEYEATAGATTQPVDKIVPVGPIVRSAKIVAQPDLTVGKRITAFKATKMDGSPVNFPADYKGKLVMLDFWATWCGPCMGEVPGLVKLYNGQHPKGFEILGVSLDQPNAADHVKSVMTDQGMTWPQIYDGKFWKAEIAQLYGIESIPTAFLVRGDTGEILATGDSLRGENLGATIADALANKRIVSGHDQALQTMLAARRPATTRPTTQPDAMFWYTYVDGVPRLWLQADATHWEENYPDGRTVSFLILKTISDGQTPGIVVRRQPDDGFEVLIPPHEGEPLRFHFNSTESWQSLGPIHKRMPDAALAPPVAPATQPVATVAPSPASEPAAAVGELNCIDAKGNPIDAAMVPDDLKNGVRAVLRDITGKDATRAPMGLVLGRVVFPVDEDDKNFASMLVSSHGYGGYHWLSLSAGRRPNIPVIADAVCIKWSAAGEVCTLEIQKLGYRKVGLPVPTAKMGGKVVWMGEVKLERFPASAARELKGNVVTIDGQPLLAAGEVTIRVNGTPATMRGKLHDGHFSFESITPNNYLVEFFVDGYSIPTWWAAVPEGKDPIEKTLVAYPRYKLSVRFGKDQPIQTVTCGVAYRDGYLPLPGRPEQLQVDQSGPAFELYDMNKRVVVCDGPLQDNQALLARIKGMKLREKGGFVWYSWGGKLAKGQLIVLVDDPGTDPHELSPRASVSTVMEVVAIDPNPETAAVESLTVVDAEGHLIADANVPEVVRTSIRSMPARQLSEIRAGEVGIVVAHIVLPADESDQTACGTFANRQGYGSTGQLKADGDSPDLPNVKNVLWRDWTDFSIGCTFSVYKPGYRSTSIAIAPGELRGKVIWLGDIKPERYAPSAAHIVRGAVINPDKTAFTRGGTVSIRLAASPLVAPDLVDLTLEKDGTFSFSGIYPGEYEIAFHLDHSIADRWYAHVTEQAGPVAGLVVARPQLQISLREIGGDASRSVTFTCGGKDNFMTLRDGSQLRLNQSGKGFLVSSSWKYRIIACEGPFKDAASLLQLARGNKNARCNWEGPLTKGQLIVLMQEPPTTQPDQPGIAEDATLLTVISVDEITVPAVEPSEKSAAQPAQ